MSKSLWLLLYMVAGFALFLGGCAAPESVSVQRYFWPIPPEDPKVEFIGVYSSEDSFEKSDFLKAQQAFLGKEDQKPFRGPYGVAADDEGKVFVSDVYTKNIRVYDFNSKKVSFLLAKTYLQKPYDLDMDSAKNLYVVDPGLSKVLVLSRTGENLYAYGNKDSLQQPVYVAINERLRRLYVSDAGSHKIVVFDLDSREVVFEFGGLGAGDGQFFSCQGVAIDRDDNVYVADMLNARVQVFDRDGNFKSKFGTRGDDIFTFEFPKDLAFDVDDNLWLVDSRRPYYRAYQKDGTLLLVVGAEQRTKHPMALAYPVSIHITPKSAIYVTDFLNRRFSQWQYVTPEYLLQNPITPK